MCFCGSLAKDWLRHSVPIALGQAVQVPPGDVLAEVLLGSTLNAKMCFQLSVALGSG